MSTADHRWIKLVFSHTHPPGSKPSSNLGFVHKAALTPCASQQPHLFSLGHWRKQRWVKGEVAYRNTSKDCSISSNSNGCAPLPVQIQRTSDSVPPSLSITILHMILATENLKSNKEIKNSRKLDMKYRLKLNSIVFLRRTIISVNVHKCNSSILIVSLLQHNQVSQETRKLWSGSSLNLNHEIGRICPNEK